jgi:hypothetical protein
MRDVVYVALTIAFFALAALLVRGCDRIVGPDPSTDEGDDAPEVLALTEAAR